MLAEKNFDNRIVTNIIMLGFVSSYTGVVSKEAITEAVKSVVPQRMVKLNTDALEFGFDYKVSEAEKAEV
jgi:Pyruvate/2-oxoacid:ferredoxin oxidoreductase gamma subunit